MTTKYEFRDILPEELDQVIQIESRSVFRQMRPALPRV